MIRGIYYGWWIVVAAFCTLFVCAGIGFFSFPVFLKFIETDMGWDRDTLSKAVAISALAAGFSTPAVGYVVDRYGPRAVMLLGAAVLSASFVLLGQITTIYQLYVLFLGIGIGMAATTIIPCQTLVSRWFERRRGRAMGIVTVANGLGGIVWMPVSNSLIEAKGWRSAYEILGIIIAAVSLPLIWFIIRSSPRSMGLALDGEQGPSPEATTHILSEGEAGYSVREALRTASFWLIFSATFFGIFSIGGFGTHVVAFLSDSGLSSSFAAAVWSVTLGVSIGGRFLFGFLSEKFEKRYFAFAANVARTLSLLLLMLFALQMAPRVAAVVQLVVVYGLALGCSAVINPLLVSETFGVKAFGKLMGLLGIAYTIGMALGPWLGGHLFVSQSNYIIAFGVYAAAFLVAGVAIAFAKPCFLLDHMSGRKEGKR